MTLPDNKPYLTAKDVAGLLMVSPGTIRLWTEKGLLKSELTLGGHRRFLRSEVEKMLQGRGVPAEALAHLPLEHSKPVSSVLIIDDDLELAHTMADGLRAALPQLEVHIASNGFSGGMQATLHRPDFVLLDLMMPGMNGIDVCRMLKKQPETRKTRIIAYTGHASEEQMEAVIAQGAEDCLSKPVRIPQLLRLMGIKAAAPSVS